jgi:serine/threonine protein kinase
VPYADFPRPEHLLGHRIAGRYLVETLCERTPHSASYRAYHAELDQTVLLRLLAPRAGLDRNACYRALELAECINSLPSAHLSRTLDIGVFGERWPFSVSEYSKGRTLARVLETEGPQPIERVLSLGIQAASALATVHAARRGHGSLDLEGLWLECLESRPPWLRVMNFGLSELPPFDFDGLDSGVFSSAGRRARPGPESRSALIRADLHALGSALYQLATGARPAWTGNQPAAILDTDFGFSALPSDRALRRGLAMSLQRCLYLLPDTNYESMAELAQDLERLTQAADCAHSFASPNRPPVTTIATPPRARAVPRGEPKVIVRGS